MGWVITNAVWFMDWRLLFVWQWEREWECGTIGSLQLNLMSGDCITVA